MVVATGLDRLSSHAPPWLKTSRVGILSHQASVDRHLRPVVDLLREKKFHITALYGPEHGLWGTAQDQIEVPDASAALPVYSLYGDHRYPTASQLAGIDVMICDLQDVGSRYYTFVWTMALAMQACARFGKKFIVLDRPNPINGNTLEGPLLNPDFASFVGLYPVPVRHGMTMGEIALWVNDGLGIHANLDVIEMQGWKRSMHYDETGLPWVLPSPNMPTLDTALVYPGGCLIEGTQLSEGRGTTRPFEIFGAPYIAADWLEQDMRRRKLPGVEFRACRFEPTFHKFAGQVCGGVQVHITNRKTFKPFYTYVILIETIRDRYPNDFAWRPPPYEYEKEKLPFDILCGTDAVRLALEKKSDLKSLETSWNGALDAFRRQRKPFLLYN